MAGAAQARQAWGVVVVAFGNIAVVAELVVEIAAVGESPLARRVAGELWAGLSRAALDAGYEKATAMWRGFGPDGGEGATAAPDLCLISFGQDSPEAVDLLGGCARAAHDGVLHGLVVAVPRSPNPLAGPLLYQGVERLGIAGVRAGDVEPALLREDPNECERYARRLLDRLASRGVPGRRTARRSGRDTP